jgi:hypothetical protein
LRWHRVRKTNYAMDLAAPLALMLAGLYVVIRKAAAAGRAHRRVLINRR